MLGYAPHSISSDIINDSFNFISSLDTSHLLFKNTLYSYSPTVVVLLNTDIIALLIEVQPIIRQFHNSCLNSCKIFKYSVRADCFHMSRLVTKPIKWALRPAKTQNSLPSLIRVFAVRMKKSWALSYPLSPLRRLWSDWADAQADLSLRWAQSSFCWFCHEAAHI